MVSFVQNCSRRSDVYTSAYDSTKVTSFTTNRLSSVSLLRSKIDQSIVTGPWLSQRILRAPASNLPKRSDGAPLSIGMVGRAGTYGRGAACPAPATVFEGGMVIDSPFTKGRSPAVPRVRGSPCGARGKRGG